MGAAGSHLLRLGPALWKFACGYAYGQIPKPRQPLSLGPGWGPGACTGFDWKEDFEAEEIGKSFPPI